MGLLEKTIGLIFFGLVCFGLGMWSAFHMATAFHEAEVFRQFVVRKLTGTQTCDTRQFVCTPVTETHGTN